MSMNANLHNPVIVEKIILATSSGAIGILKVEDRDGSYVTIYTTPEAARAMAEAFNAAMAKPETLEPA